MTDRTEQLAEYRLRCLIGQLRISRPLIAALLRAIADDHDPAADVHLNTAAEDEAARLREAGFTVTPSLEVRTAGAAYLLGRSSKTLRNWRSSGAGPEWRSDHGIVLYSLPALLAWRCPEPSRVSPLQHETI